MPNPIETVSKPVATQAAHGQVFYHVTAQNADGSAVRVRVSGRCKTWKTRPDEFRLPVKYGLRESLAITHENFKDFLVSDPTRC